MAAIIRTIRTLNCMLKHISLYTLAKTYHIKTYFLTHRNICLYLSAIIIKTVGNLYTNGGLIRCIFSILAIIYGGKCGKDFGNKELLEILPSSLAQV